MSEERETGTVAEGETERAWEARIEAIVKRALETQLPAAIAGARGTGGKCYGFLPQGMTSCIRALTITVSAWPAERQQN